METVSRWRLPAPEAGLLLLPPFCSLAAPHPSCLLRLPARGWERIPREAKSLPGLLFQVKLVPHPFLGKRLLHTQAPQSHATQRTCVQVAMEEGKENFTLIAPEELTDLTGLMGNESYLDSFPSWGLGRLL